jgi:16S rRNA (cytidine1402-2'-O)-methyltransferase
MACRPNTEKPTPKTDPPQGVLYVVGTPIGNLEDISLRALRILKEVDLVAAEDTRRTRHLLTHYGIKKPLLSYFSHNKVRRSRDLLRGLAHGQDIALVSEAGMPGVSDPGALIVNLAREQGVEVISVPGPSAPVTALAVSGFPGTRVVFEGFLSPKRGRRQRRLREVAREDRTLIFFESPHRLSATLKDMRDILGARRVLLAREMTKKFEETRRGQLSDFIERFDQEEPRGEFTLVIEGFRHE